MKYVFCSVFLFLLLILTSCGTKKTTTSHSKNSSKKYIEEKYSKIIGVDIEKISNHKLYAFIDEWYGAPYQYGGKTKKGIDCSGFATILYKNIFDKEITGSSSSIYKQCTTISKNKLEEGDLVFFKIESKEISHIGIYLQNNKFVHASTKAGVIISDLNEDYYKKYYEGCGRIK